MENQIERDVYVTYEPLKNPISYVRGTDALPIVFHFRDYDIPSGASVSVFVAKPSGKAVYNSATISGNDVTVTVDSQMFMELGTSEMQVSISQGGKELVQFAQPVNVKANLKAGDFPDSSTSSSFLDDMIAQAQEAVNNANIAAQQAQTAVQNANLAVSNANDAVDSVNAMISSMGANFSSLAQSANITQLQTTSKNLVGAINELNSKIAYDYYDRGKNYNLDNLFINSAESPGEIIRYFRNLNLGTNTGAKFPINATTAIIIGDFQIIFGYQTSVYYRYRWGEWSGWKEI